jgi:hypothetical protein
MGCWEHRIEGLVEVWRMRVGDFEKLIPAVQQLVSICLKGFEMHATPHCGLSCKASIEASRSCVTCN